MGPNIWNSLPVFWKATEGLNTYKQNEKTFSWQNEKNESDIYRYFLLLFVIYYYYYYFIIIIIIIVIIIIIIFIFIVIIIIFIIITIIIDIYYYHQCYYYYFCYGYLLLSLNSFLLSLILRTLLLSLQNKLSSKSEYPFNKVLFSFLFFKGTEMEIKLHSFFVLSLASHLMFVFWFY